MAKKAANNSNRTIGKVIAGDVSALGTGFLSGQTSNFQVSQTMRPLPLVLLVFTFTFGSAFAQKPQPCYVWADNHWERTRAGVQYPPGVVQCGEKPPSGPPGGVTVQDAKGPRPPAKSVNEPGGSIVRDHRRPQYTVQETPNERKYIVKTLEGVDSINEKLWSQAVTQQMGVIGTDYRGYEDTGSAAFQRAVDTHAACYTKWNRDAIARDLVYKTLAVAQEITDKLTLGFSSDALATINFWYPNYRRSGETGGAGPGFAFGSPPKHYKRTAVGTVTEAKYANEQCVYFDDDLNIDIILDTPYSYLVKDGQPGDDTNLTRLTGQDCSKAKQGFEKLELEIAVHNRFKQIVLEQIKSTKRLATYGAWIYDKGHCNHPEIHPAEQLWWKDGNTYTLGLFADASKRFAYKAMMDDGRITRPWAQPPIRGYFAIAFEVGMPSKAQATGAASYPVKKLEAENVTHHTVIDYLKTEKLLGDREHGLYFQNVKIVSFHPHNNSIKVSFERMGVTSSGTIKGFLVLETQVGQMDLKEPFRLGVKLPNLPKPIKIPTNALPEEISAEVGIRAYNAVQGHYLFRVRETSSGGVGAATR